MRRIESDELSSYVEKLVKCGPGSTTLRLSRLLAMAREYPREPLLAAIFEAEHYGLFDLERVERMVLARIAGNFFRLPYESSDAPGEDDDR